MKKSWVAFFLACVAGSCIDEIQVDLPEANEVQRVVEGLVERDGENYIFWAQVNSTVDVTGDLVFQNIEANISIKYNGDPVVALSSGERKLMNIEEFHGLYGGDPSSATFSLEANVGGDRYLSESVGIRELPIPDSLSVRVEVRPEINSAGNIISVPYVQLLAHTPLVNANGERTSLQWSVSSVFQFIEAPRESDPLYDPKTCYVGHDVFRNDVNIANAQEFSGRSRVQDYQIAEVRSSYRFAIGYYFNVVQKSLAQDAVEYWTEVKASNERSGNIYDVFPGRIRSNIRNESNVGEPVNGYFQVSAVDTIRLKVLPGDVERPNRFCLYWEEPMQILPDDPDPCVNCLNILGARLDKPKYWE